MNWTEAASPFLTVGTLEIPAVEVDSEAFAALQTRIEALSFDPWHAVEELRPVGALNRARRAVYFASTQHRGGTGD